MNDRGTLETVIWESTQAVRSFQPIISSPENIKSWMADLGWDVGIPAEINLLDIQTALSDLVNTVDAIDFSQPAKDQIDKYDMALHASLDFINELSNLHTIFNGVDVPPGFFDNAVSQIVNDVILNHLESNHPSLYSFLIFFGIIVLEKRKDIPNRIDYTHRHLNLKDLISYISDPKEAFVSVYKWGTDDFEVDKLLSNLNYLVQDLGIPSYVIKLSDEQENYLQNEFDEEIKANQFQLRIPFYDFAAEDVGSAEIGASIIPLFKQNLDGIIAEGISIQPYVEGSTEAEISLGSGFALRISGNIDISLLGKITPQGVSILNLNELGQSTDFHGDLYVSLKKKPETLASRIVLIGQTGGSRIDLESFAFTWGVITNTDTVEMKLEVDFNNGEIFIQSNEADSFLQKVLPPDGIRAELDFTLGWSSFDGVYFKGSAGLEVTIPIHKSIGPVKIHSVYVAIGLEEKTITTILATSIGAKIGPVDVSVERIGIKLPIGFPENRDGNLGPINLEVPQFHPPKGAGASIETDAFTGAGYLDFDEENQRYVGMLQIEASGYGVNATGLITTKMPDGSNGFSMLAIIATEFNPGIALGAGFFLEGVGGLVGIHRSMLVDRIRQGIRDRSIDSILYPEDIVLNASRIISDLRGTFPPTEGRYVFGPIARITFAHYVQGEIGFMIEVPGPIRPVMLGQTALVIEKEDNVLVEIHEDVLGAIDFAKKTISYDASIYDSSILIFSLTGDSAFRLSWGDQPNFALAIGGLNPRYTPPPNFPNMNRLRLSLGYRDIVRLNLDIYLAITSNSFHHGARIEVSAEKGKFSLHGHLGFDTLFNFSPFFFVADAGCSVDIKLGSKTITTVQLDLTFSGPQPWQVAGKAKFKCLGIKKSISVNATWGGGAPATLEPVNPWPLLKAALEDPGNWEAKVPESVQTAVTLRKIKIPSGAAQPTDIVVLNPMAGLEIRQRVLPLNMEMDLFGNAPIEGDKLYRVKKVLPDGTTKDVDHGKDYFARAQFQSMSDEAKLSLPAFEKLDASIMHGVDEVDTRQPVPFPLTYETKVIDDNRVTREERDGGRTLPWRSASYQLAGSAARTAVISTSRLRAYAHPGAEAKVTMTEEGYGVVGTTDMSLDKKIKGNDGTLTHAESIGLMQDYLASHPEEIGNIQVAPSYEVAA